MGIGIGMTDSAREQPTLDWSQFGCSSAGGDTATLRCKKAPSHVRLRSESVLQLSSNGDAAGLGLVARQTFTSHAWPEKDSSWSAAMMWHQRK
nr:hypothetical protein CFP56_50456 [Quercus suber]